MGSMEDHSRLCWLMVLTGGSMVVVEESVDDTGVADSHDRKGCHVQVWYV